MRHGEDGESDTHKEGEDEDPPFPSRLGTWSTLCVAPVVVRGAEGAPVCRVGVAWSTGVGPNTLLGSACHKCGRVGVESVKPRAWGGTVVATDTHTVALSSRLQIIISWGASTRRRQAHSAVTTQTRTMRE